MVESRISGEESVEHGAQQKNSRALERPFVDRHRNLNTTCGTNTAALANAAHDRPAVNIANATNAALGDSVGHLCEHRQGLLQRLAIASRAAFHKAEMIGAEHVDEAPGDGAGMGDLAT